MKLRLSSPRNYLNPGMLSVLILREKHCMHNFVYDFIEHVLLYMELRYIMIENEESGISMN